MSRLSVGAVADVSFGGLNDFALDGLGHDFVVVSGRNEAGKSTLAEFIAWMIAGPIGKTADAARFGDKDAVVGGRLLGTLAGEPLDLAGSFTILDNGAPKDIPNKGQQPPRRGTVGSIALDGAQLLVRLGALTPAAYDLLYRIGSETAHLLASESGLVELFAKYATGAIDSSVDPRAVVKSLTSDLNRVKRDLAELTKAGGSRATVQKQLDEAVARPGRIRDIESEIARMEQERASVGASISAESERLGDLRTAIGVFGRNEAARAAERAFDDSVELPADVEAIAGDLDAVVDLAARIEKARAEVADAEPDVASACGAVGLDAATLAGHVLTNDDKKVFRDAAALLSGKKNDLRDAEIERVRHDEELRAARDHADTCLAHGALDGEMLRKRILDVDTVTGLGNPAYAVDQATREVGRCERTLEAARLASPTPGDPTGDTQSVGGGAWRSLLPAVLGVIGAVGGGFVNMTVSAAAGVIGLVVGVLIGRFWGGGVASRATVPARVEADQVAIAQAALDAARLDLAAKLAVVNDSLVGLGLPPVTAERAGAHIADLDRALRALAEVRRLESLTGGLDQRVAECTTGVSVAEVSYGRLFEQRGLPKVSEVGVDSWLDVYADSIGRAAEHARLLGHCSALENELVDTTRGVARLSDVSSPSVVADRAREYVEVRDERERLERAARERRNDADIAMGDRPQVRQLLGSANKEMLEAEARSLEASIGELEERRSAIDGELGARRTELQTLLKGELVADLTEELGRIDDQIDDLVREYAVFAAALESIETVVGEYELRNQGPVIEAAQDLIMSVDPEFGSLYVDRATGDPKLMVDRSGRRIPVGRLSTGARALVYFALRLAFQMVDSQGRAVALPLICDDPLVTIDDRRVEPIMRLLRNVSEQRQVIYLTCHERESQIAGRLGARVVTL